MYKCEECELIFDDPKEISAETYYGVASEFNYSSGETIKVCPRCEGTYKEIEEKDEEND